MVALASSKTRMEDRDDVDVVRSLFCPPPLNEGKLGNSRDGPMTEERRLLLRLRPPSCGPMPPPFPVPAVASTKAAAAAAEAKVLIGLSLDLMPPIVGTELSLVVGERRVEEQAADA
jgi:hypothetical protein